MQGPAMSVSLLASAMSFPASMAATVGCTPRRNNMAQRQNTAEDDTVGTEEAGHGSKRGILGRKNGRSKACPSQPK